jgi:hypothetical protein
MLFSDTQQAHPCGLGKFIPEFDGLKTTSQTQHQSLAARAEGKKPPSAPTTAQDITPFNSQHVVKKAQPRQRH